MFQWGIGDQATLRPSAQPAASLTGNEPSGVRKREFNPESVTAPEAMRGVSWDFSKVPLFPPDRANRPQPSLPLAATPFTGAIQQKGVKKVPTHEIHYLQQPISARIRRSYPSGPDRVLGQRRNTAAVLRPEPNTFSSSDAGLDGNAPDLNTQAAQIDYTAPPLNVPEPNEGQAVSVPDIVPMGALEVVDTVASTLSYQPIISNTGAVNPGSFGSTLVVPPSVNGTLIWHNGGSYTITTTLIQSIPWQVLGSTGPQGQIDIESIVDPAITSSNFGQVVSDLTPNPADPQFAFRSPRIQFWARDLSADHEVFHASEIAVHGKQGANLAQNFLNRSSASSLSDVWGLLNQVPGLVTNTIVAAMPLVPRETRAYAAGAANYQLRANAIRIIGNAGGYP
jgi:hypothetical protein